MTAETQTPEKDARQWRVSEFAGLVVFIAMAAAVLPLVRDSYIIQDVWIAICGVVGIN